MYMCMEKDAAACLYIYNSLEFTDVYKKGK
jgi:hypothetical protein